MLRTRLTTLIVIALLVVIVACGGKSEKDRKNVLLPDAGSAHNRSQTEAASELQKVVDAYTKVKTFRATLEVEGPGFPKQRGNLEVVMPDKFHAKYPPVADQPGTEVILIGSDTYFKTGDAWTKQAAPQGATVLNASGVQSTVQSLVEAGASKGPTDTVEGKKCQSYSASGQSGKQEICIADNLPLRYSLETGDIKTTLTFSDYNKDIEIKAPV